VARFEQPALAENVFDRNFLGIFGRGLFRHCVGVPDERDAEKLR
jgi:hypothetical protein